MSSTKGCGRTAPHTHFYRLIEGVLAPVGVGEPTNVEGPLLYNEYIVYDTRQIRMKYLLKVRFDFN